MSHNEKLRQKFINEGLKIDAEYYKQKVLATHLLLHADRLHPKKELDVSDSAPSYQSKTTQTWLHDICSEFNK